MIASFPQERSSQGHWNWSLPFETYDCSLDLSASEEEAVRDLNDLIKRRKTHYQKQLYLVLNRLVQPIYDALALAQVKGDRRHSACNTLFQQMLMRQKTFWGWTLEEWENTLGKQILDRHRYPISTIAYLLCQIRDFNILTLPIPTFSKRIFGEALLNAAVDELTAILQAWGYRGKTKALYSGICRVLLANGSPYLEDLTPEALIHIQAKNISAHDGWVVGTISRALVGLGYFQSPLPSRFAHDQLMISARAQQDIAPEWAEICQKWDETSTFESTTRRNLSRKLLRIGRWLGETHPEIVHPGQWTRQLAAEFVAAVNQLQSGDWCHEKQAVTYRGKPMAPASKNAFLHAARTFFSDCQEWEWIPVRFNPAQCFQTPRAILAAIGPKPRVIADDLWAKLLYAGLNLTSEDLPRNLPSRDAIRYPLEMVRAIAIVWLFAGLRSDEIRRLRVGCIRWQFEEERISGQAAAKAVTCLLDVPVNKTGSAFTKPVDYYVGEAVSTWEQLRPIQPAALDSKTSEMVTFLFSYRGRQIGASYLNDSLIPLLCRKAGIPQQDARGNITCHRARSTIASQLYNAKEPMTLVELQAWLGHKHPNTTQHYTKISPTKLAKSYTDADYFARNVRTIEVLIDQDAVLNGDAASGLPWKYYDLGHGYCTYDFFEQCEHRMACAHCSFYRPKAAFLDLLLEKQRHLLHMQQDIPLTELELATVEGDLEATQKLIGQLVDIPTPSGLTPRQLMTQNAQAISVYPDGEEVSQNG